jgi:hypothetical protein
MFLQPGATITKFFGSDIIEKDCVETSTLLPALILIFAFGTHQQELSTKVSAEGDIGSYNSISESTIIRKFNVESFVFSFIIPTNIFCCAWISLHLG